MEGVHLFKPCCPGRANMNRDISGRMGLEAVSGSQPASPDEQDGQCCLRKRGLLRRDAIQMIR